MSRPLILFEPVPACMFTSWRTHVSANMLLLVTVMWSYCSKSWGISLVLVCLETGEESGTLLRKWTVNNATECSRFLFLLSVSEFQSTSWNIKLSKRTYTTLWCLWRWKITWKQKGQRKRFNLKQMLVLWHFLPPFLSLPTLVII